MPSPRHLTIIVGLLVAGCSSSAPSTLAIPESQMGTYRFMERIGGGSMQAYTETLEGTVTILRDSIILDMTPGPCRYEDRSRTSTSLSYRCADVVVGFDRSNPVLRAYYSTTIIERVPVRVCIRYATNAAGQQVCAEYGTDYQERRAPKSGTLRLTRQMG